MKCLLWTNSLLRYVNNIPLLSHILLVVLFCVRVKYRILINILNPFSRDHPGLFTQASLQGSGTISNVKSSDGGGATSSHSAGIDLSNTSGDVSASASASASVSTSASASASASASRDMINLTPESSNENSHDPGDGDINDTTMDAPTNATTNNVSTSPTASASVSSTVAPQDAVFSAASGTVDDS